MRHTVIGLFDTLAHAQTAQAALLQTGFGADDIVVQTSAGLAAEAPADRPGMLADIERFLASLFAAGPRQTEAQRYMEAVRRGAVLLYVDTANEAQTDLARSTLTHLGATDIGERTPEWDVLQPGPDPAREHSILDELGIGALLRPSAGAVASASGVAPVSEPAHETFSSTATPVSPDELPAAAPATTAIAAGAVAGLGAVFQPAPPQAEKAPVEATQETLQSGQIPDEFLEYEEDFRGHYDTQYAGESARYEDYVSAYRYGATIAQDHRYQAQLWDEVEPHVQREWEHTLPGSGTWEKVKAAVRHGWERASTHRTNG
ncbi:hypothetical protein QS306_13695 [Paraburkholderia bonniea]|uniref:hypothetical protein n=1 Tax=Paraburkholderia bonniea TaxID=2152891 RepID=UPI0025727390|nr:hypothetical protein [Paraburkholderia bonniea]WJF91828.1 hypothetical protein QS306_13695 [Paraburkholderia bonniea]WJF95147.1 hypothetical protein QS308_13705 [Paraburkholderia bonniea]